MMATATETQLKKKQIFILTSLIVNLNKEFKD